jgi:hypothetical protein
MQCLSRKSKQLYGLGIQLRQNVASRFVAHNLSFNVYLIVGQHYFYNLVPPEQVSAFGRPPNATNEGLWQRAVRENPDPSWYAELLLILLNVLMVLPLAWYLFWQLASMICVSA